MGLIVAWKNNQARAARAAIFGMSLHPTPLIHSPTRVSDGRTGRTIGGVPVARTPAHGGFPVGSMAAWDRSMAKPIPVLAAAAFLFAPMARAAEPGRSVAGPPGILRQLNGALSQLADRVSPAVVQIQVSGYGPASNEDGHPGAAFIVRQHGVGSGVIVDSAGYIVTNAHVVQGAQRIVVVLPAAVAGRTVRQDSARKRVYPRIWSGFTPSRTSRCSRSRLPDCRPSLCRRRRRARLA